MRDYSLLKGYADTYESAVRLRIDTNNRMRCWLRDTLPPEEWGDIDLSDKKLHDKTVYELLPNDQRMFVQMILDFEKSAQMYLHKEVKKHYLWGWLDEVKGIGANLAAKLLSRLGDIDRFPTVSHLWSYCGLDGEGWRQRKHNWALTPICHLIAKQFVKQGDVYRKIYVQRKEYEATKPPCEKCIEQGFLDSCRPGHIDNKARRYTVKQFLKDLWLEHKRITSGEEKGTDVA